MVAAGVDVRKSKLRIWESESAIVALFPLEAYWVQDITFSESLKRTECLVNENTFIEY